MVALLIVIVIVVVVASLWLMIRARSNKRKAQALVTEPSGSTRVESVPASAVNLTVRQYTRAGWTVEQQSTAKSLGSQARVTITFRKN